MLPADFAKDDYDQWLQLEGQDQVDRNLFSVEQARGQLHWLERCMPPAFIAMRWPIRICGRWLRVRSAARAHGSAGDAGAARVRHVAVAAPATPRPMIKDVKPIAGTPFVQWDEPISPAENAAILARLATYPA